MIFLSPEFGVFAMAVFPGLEARVAIPWGVGLAELTPFRAGIIAYLGGAFVVFAITPLFYAFGKRLAVLPVFRTVFARTQKRLGKRFERGKSTALVTFVALPLPFSGVWSGIIAAFTFGIPKHKAIPLILLGLFFGTTFLVLATEGVVRPFE